MSHKNSMNESEKSFQKPFSDRPINQKIPQIPKLNNAFHYSDGSIYSSGKLKQF